jgi:hypothetical protein
MVFSEIACSEQLSSKTTRSGLKSPKGNDGRNLERAGSHLTHAKFMNCNPAEFEYWYDRLPGERKRKAWEALTSDQRKLWNERWNFRNFAKVAPLDIDARTIESCCPPEPDILCRISGKAHYFELAEVTDENLARRVAIAGKQGKDTFGGPFMQLEPLCRIYNQKCSKKYKTDGHDLHLLLYYSTDHQVPYTEGLREEISKLQDAIEKKFRQSPFRTAWLYDGWNEAIIERVQFVA